MSNILGWKAFYTENRVFSSTDMTWDELPKSGVLAVAIFMEHPIKEGEVNREVMAGTRRYFMAIGSSGNYFIKGSLWKQKNLLDTYNTKEEWIKEGIFDDDVSFHKALRDANQARYGG